MGRHEELNPHVAPACIRTRFARTHRTLPEVEGSSGGLSVEIAAGGLIRELEAIASEESLVS